MQFLELFTPDHLSLFESAASKVQLSKGQYLIRRGEPGGDIYHLERDFDQAIWYYSKAIELSWGFAVAWTNRGDAYMARGDLGEAMWDFNVACQLGYQPACRELHVLER